MKRALLIFSFGILFLTIFVSASSSVTISTPERDYNISLSFVDQTSARLIINGQNTISFDEKDSPYYLSNSYNGIYPILTQASLGKDSGLGFTTFLFFIEQNLTEENGTVIYFQDNSYNISLSFVDQTSARLVINGQNTILFDEKNSPYYLSNSYNGIYPILTQASLGKDASPGTANFFFVYELNLTEECIEDWSCTNWSTCSNNSQTRTCADLNSCGTLENKPSENKSCSEPSPNIECYSDEDCLVEGTGEPYCEGDQLCLPYMNFECINDGTEESYCSPYEGVDCEYDESCDKSPKEECTQIGLRQSGQYCSINYNLIDQKKDGSSCENNFECKSNVCENSICGGNEEPSSNTIYWILGGVLVIGIIVFFISFKPKR